MKKASDSWGRLFPVGFALAWIGVFSVLWIHIKMSSQFGSIAAFGVSWPWPRRDDLRDGNLRRGHGRDCLDWAEPPPRASR
jgi:hypothetical protein